MSDEAKTEEENVEEKAGGNPLIPIVIAAVVLLIAAGGGFGVYRLVLAPRLAVDDPGGDDPTLPDDTIPPNPVSLQFDQKFVNLVRDDDSPAAILVFQVTLECANQVTFDTIVKHRIRFEDMLIKLHDSRTRAELDDTLALKTSIQRQARQKANDLLRRVQAKPDPENQITGVFHNLFAVQEQG